jgi:multiple sugar transport system permease protein
MKQRRGKYVSQSEISINPSKKIMKVKKKSKQDLTETLMGFFFVGPLLIGLLVLTFIPIIASIIFSFSDWSLVQSFDQLKFIGLENYKKLFNDPVFLKSLTNNFVLIIAVPLTMSISLFLAVIINKHVFMKDFFKVIYFMPYISSVVAVAIVYQVIFHPSYGPVNQTLIAMGIDNPPMWLADIKVALFSVIGIMVWIGIGYNMIIYIAGLQSVPKELYEAADIDGANSIQKFFKITVPLLTPTTFFLLVTGVIGTFKVFDLITVLTAGGPANATNVMVYYLYDQGFTNLKTGYSSAISVVLLVCVLIITYLQFMAQKKWVNY